jgi:hypothetical protein
VQQVEKDSWKADSPAFHERSSQFGFEESKRFVLTVQPLWKVLELSSRWIEVSLLPRSVGKLQIATPQYRGLVAVLVLQELRFDSVFLRLQFHSVSAIARTLKVELLKLRTWQVMLMTSPFKEERNSRKISTETEVLIA